MLAEPAWFACIPDVGCSGEAGELPNFGPGPLSSEESQEEPEKRCAVPNNEGSQQLCAALSGILNSLSE